MLKYNTLFEGVDSVHIQGYKITQMISKGNEKVTIPKSVGSVYCDGNVEEWLSLFEEVMKKTVRDVLKRATASYKRKEREVWALD